MDKKQKNKKDMGKMGVRIMALILTILMVLAVASTLIYYLIVMKLVKNEITRGKVI